MRKSWRTLLPLISGVVFLLALGVLVFLFAPHRFKLAGSVNNASLYLVQTSDAFLNQTFEVSVQMDTLGSSVNAVGVYLRFDPQALQLLDYDTQTSFCQFYPEKKFDNHAGSVSLACGSPHPGVRGSSQLLNLKFVAKQLGVSTLYVLSESQVLKSDGTGTNILDDYPSLVIDVKSNI
jgi:hypothetical protein